VAMDGASSFVVIWKDKREGNYDIYAQRYSSNGNPDGKNYKVNNSPDLNEQSQPAVAANGGKIFFTWKDSSSDNCDIVAKVVEWNWTEVEGNENSFNLPNEFYLHQNYPNPFNSTTTMQFRAGSLEFREPIHTTLMFTIL